MEKQVICENPKWIVNQTIRNYLANTIAISINGVETPVRFRKNSYFTSDSIMKAFSARLHRGKKTIRDIFSRFPVIQYYTDEELDCKLNPAESYLITTDGEAIPIYQQVPCGHCVLCSESKQNSFVQRCNLETQLYEYYPYFCTLTLNRQNLEYVKKECADGKTRQYATLSVRQCQLFMKRLRINLKRMYGGKYDSEIRYAIRGEYGHSKEYIDSHGEYRRGTFRPHYHCIIWNLPAKTSEDYINVKSIIEKSWKLGHSLIVPINPADKQAPNRFKYTAKYMSKTMQNKPVDECKDSFLLTSRKNGSIGAPYVRMQLQRYARQSMNHRLRYYNHFKGRDMAVYFNSWLLNIIFPSFCRLVPSDVRKAVVELSCSKYAPVMSAWSKYMYIPTCEIPLSYETRDLNENCKILTKWYTKHNITCTEELDKLLYEYACMNVRRQEFLHICFDGKEPVDIQKRANVSNYNYNRAKSLEQL